MQSLLRLFLFCITLPVSLFCQSPENLVLNPSFETLKNDDWEIVSDHLNAVVHWKSATGGTPDVIQPDNGDKFSFTPRTGKVVAGLYAYFESQKGQEKIDQSDYREYILGQLSHNLRPGWVYEVSFWVSTLPEWAMVCNNLGVAFSTGKFYSGSSRPLYQMKPQFNHQSVVEAPAGEWVQIKGEFVAVDTFTHFVIGNFFSNDNTLSTKAFSGSIDKGCYYLIDDVSVVELYKYKAKPLPVDTLALGKFIPAGKDVYVLPNVQFDFNSASFGPGAYNDLDLVVAWMKANPTVSVHINGHTDDTGSSPYNLELSTLRARSVYDYLVAHGVDPLKMSYKGFGADKPLVAGSSELARRKNRRVELEWE